MKTRSITLSFLNEVILMGALQLDSMLRRLRNCRFIIILFLIVNITLDD